MEKKTLSIIFIILIILSIAAYKFLFEDKSSDNSNDTEEYFSTEYHTPIEFSISTGSNIPIESNVLIESKVPTGSKSPIEKTVYFKTEFTEVPTGFNQFVKTVNSFHFDEVLKESMNIPDDKRSALKAIVLANLFNMYRLSDYKRNFYYETELGDPKLLDDDAKRINKLKEMLLKIIELDMNTTLYFFDPKMLFEFDKITLSNFHLVKLPSYDILKVFKNLKALDLTRVGHSNGFETLSIIEGLTCLDLTDNNITKFPNFSNFKSLEIVYLDKNDITKIYLNSYLKSKGSSEYNTSNIKTIYLSLNPIDKIDNNILKVFPNLSEFYITNGIRPSCTDLEFLKNILKRL